MNEKVQQTETGNALQRFLKRKNIEISAKRYGIDALGAMAQGLFCSLLIGTIIKTLGQQLSIQYLIDIGAYAMAVSGPAMAVAIGYALKADPMVLFSLAAVGWAANAEGGAGGPLAVLIIAIIAAECGKMVSKETKVDILVTPGVTILIGVALAKLIAPPIGTAASAFGLVIDNATQPEVAAEFGLDPENVMDYDFDDATKNIKTYVEEVMNALAASGANTGDENRFQVK